MSDGKRIEGHLQSKKGNFPIKLSKAEEVSKDGKRLVSVRSEFDKSEIKQHGYRREIDEEKGKEKKENN